MKSDLIAGVVCAIVGVCNLLAGNVIMAVILLAMASLSLWYHNE